MLKSIFIIIITLLLCSCVAYPTPYGTVIAPAPFVVTPGYGYYGNSYYHGGGYYHGGYGWHGGYYHNG